MKKIIYMAVLCSILLSLSACNGKNTGSVESEIAIGKSDGYEKNPQPNADNPIVTTAETKKLSAPASETLDNTTVGYGQGVQFDKDNRPQGAIDAQQKYGKMGATFIGDPSDKSIYLTFDEGYENGYTAQILDTLKEKGVTATFFVTYDYCSRNKELVGRMIAEGHTVGNHTFSHPSMPNCSDSEVGEEIKKLHDYVKKEFKYEMTTLRPPKGEFSARTLKLTKDMGYTSVFWSFAYADWDVNNQPDETAAFEKITSRTHNGAIYLLHAVSKTNTDILGNVIDFWKAKGLNVTRL